MARSVLALYQKEILMNISFLTPFIILSEHRMQISLKKEWLVAHKDRDRMPSRLVILPHFPCWSTTRNRR